MSKRKNFLPLVLLLLIIFPATSSTSAFFKRQLTVEQPDLKARQIFTASYQQLKRGELIDLTTPLNKLKTYPLAPYLEYQLFRNQLAYGVVDEASLSHFLAAHPNTNFQKRLQAEWLEQLGQAKNWSSFLIETTRNPNPLNPRLTCFQLTAEAAIIGKSLQWKEKATHFWLANQPLATNCQNLTKQLDQLGLLSAKDYQQTAFKLMREGHTNTARLIQNKLHKTDQQWLSFWLAASANPANKLRALAQKRINLKAEATIKDEILVQLLIQGVRRHPTQTAQLSKQLKSSQHLSQEALWQVEEQLAISAARTSNHQKTITLFAAIPSNQLTDKGHEAYARTLLRQANWPTLVEALANSPATLINKNEWRYWQAHALNATQQTEQAKVLLQSLAKERHYYGFLAAQHLGLTPQMNALATPLSPKLTYQLNQNPGIKRAAELYFTGHLEEARHEWLHTLSNATTEEQIQAAWLANQWGWHHLSVDATHKAGLNDAVELRFPLAHLEVLKPLAEQANLDLPLVLALIRKESLFNPAARSRVGALGLMQVMPATGKQVAQRLKLQMQPDLDLLKPEYNLPIGINYLAGLMQRYDNNPVLAAAAYNAGPGKANAWRSSLGKEIDPLWVERITYAETRDYVKSLLAFREVYAWRLEQESLLQKTPKQKSLHQVEVQLFSQPKG